MITYTSLKTTLEPTALISLNKLQDATSLTKRDLLLQLSLLPKKPQIYLTQREWKRKGDTQVTDEIFLSITDAQTIFNIVL